MGQSRKRITKSGAERWQALYYDGRGVMQTAGTFGSQKDADAAWQRAEAKIAEGRLGDPRRGRQTFETYVIEKWLPHHVVELSTRQDYTYKINKHLIDFFGPMKMRDILPEHVRAWVTLMRKKGASPAVIQKCFRAILNAIFTAAVNDQVIPLHPCRGVKIPPVPKKPRKIVTADQFDALYQALSDADFQLLVETDIESGLRWGELTELRVKDLDFETRILTVSRAVVELNPKFHPTGDRFVVKEYPKDKEYRRIRLSEQIIRKLEAHVKAKGMGPEDLFFYFRDEPQPKTRKHRQPLNPEELGRTERNEEGRDYQHGTLTAYSTGKCRCEHCKEAYRIYRARRRSEISDNKPRTPRRTRKSDGHIPAEWFRKQIWHKACAVAKLNDVTPHHLRHAHASWLLAGGADLQVVKERLGHASIATTEKYLHTLPNADETALNALGKIRSVEAPTSAEDSGQEAKLKALEEENEHLKATVAKMAMAIHLGVEQGDQPTGSSHDHAGQTASDDVADVIPLCAKRPTG